MKDFSGISQEEREFAPGLKDTKGAVLCRPAPLTLCGFSEIAKGGLDSSRVFPGLAGPVSWLAFILPHPFPVYAPVVRWLRQAYSGGSAPDFHRLPEHPAVEDSLFHSRYYDPYGGFVKDRAASHIMNPVHRLKKADIQ